MLPELDKTVLCFVNDFALKLTLMLILCTFPSHQFPSLTPGYLRPSTAHVKRNVQEMNGGGADEIMQ